jgi:hypothetical protein
VRSEPADRQIFSTQRTAIATMFGRLDRGTTDAEVVRRPPY